jgi:histidinol phosphatase-like enzyme
MIFRDQPHPNPRSPIPGTSAPRKGLFIDRWGTLLERPSRGFRARFADAEFTPKALETLFRASQANWMIYLIGNEDAVAHGRLSESSWKKFERDLIAHLAASGIPVQYNYACLDDPVNGVEGHQKDSVFLLPNTGAMYHAVQYDGIRLDQSWVIGDSTLELAAGWRAGCRLAGVRTGQALSDDTFEVEPALVAENLSDILAQIVEMTAAAKR